MGPMRPQTRVGRLGGRIDLPAEPLRDLPSRTGRRGLDGGHERAALRLRIPHRSPSEPEAYRLRHPADRWGEPRLPEGTDGRLEDRECGQVLAPRDEGAPGERLHGDRKSVV